MTERDRELQEAFDRHLRGDGSPPDTQDDPEAAAYEAVYSTLSEEPEGDLSDDFKYQVARRVGLDPEPGMGWVEILLVLLAIAGAGAGLVQMPPTWAGFQRSVGQILMALQDVSGAFRVDVVVASLLVLILTIGFDAFLRRWRPDHHTPML